MSDLCSRSLTGGDRRTDDRDVVARRDDFESAALKRAHFHHGLERRGEECRVHESSIRSRQEEASRTIEVNTRGRRRGNRAVPQSHERDAPRFARRRVGKHFLRFEVQESQPHTAVPDNAFEMALPTTSAEAFLGIQRDDDVAAFPDTGRLWIPAEAHATAERPHSSKRIELTPAGGDARRDGICIVQHEDAARRAEQVVQGTAERRAFHLRHVRRVFDHAAPDDTREADTNRVDGLSLAHVFDELADRTCDLVGRQRGQTVVVPPPGGKERIGPTIRLPSTRPAAMCSIASTPTVNAIISPKAWPQVPEVTCVSLFRPLNAAAL